MLESMIRWRVPRRGRIARVLNARIPASSRRSFKSNSEIEKLELCGMSTLEVKLIEGSFHLF